MDSQHATDCEGQHEEDLLLKYSRNFDRKEGLFGVNFDSKLVSLSTAGSSSSAHVCLVASLWCCAIVMHRFQRPKLVRLHIK